MLLTQLFYISRLTPRTQPAVVHSILAASRKNNWRDGLTGCLLFSGHLFAQVLEGAWGPLELRFKRIREDPRHQDVRVLLERRVTSRHYPQWSMGFFEDFMLERELTDLMHSPEGSTGERVGALMRRIQPDTVLGELT